MIPQKLGPYLVEDILGRGGMGTVYRAADPVTGERVAVKILAPDLADDLAFLERFQEEVQTLLQLKHPNIVQLLSFGKQDDVFYFAMELVEGKSLYAMQKAGYRFNCIEVIEIGIQVCEGLQHSHNLGVVHRDLKPGNIIRGQDGQIKLADFGIAKRFGGQQLTMAGVLGTAEFMSPEQARGKPATIQSDLYSFGAVLFALLTGKPPFEGPVPQKILEKVVKERPPSLTDLVGDVPASLAALVDKLLKKKPENRFRSARSVASRLAEILEAMHEQAEMETNLVVADESAPSASRVSAANPTVVDSRTASKPAPKPATKTASSRQSRQAVPVRPRQAETIPDDTDEGPRSANRVIREQNFFERAVVAEHEEKVESSSGLVTALLAIGLLVVVSFSAYLVYDRVVRDRTPDELWTVIEAGQSRPTGVTKEIDAFLRLYPDDPRSEEAQKLKQIAKALQFRNMLALKATVNRGELSKLEQQFLQITVDDGSSKWDKATALDALITFYRVGEGDQGAEVDACLEAAETYRDMFRRQARPEVEREMQEIIARIETAERLESENPEQARQIRQSLIDLFGDKKWAEPLIGPLRQHPGINN